MSKDAAKVDDLDPVSRLMQVLAERWVLALALRDDTDDDERPYPTPLFYALVEPDAIGRHAAPLLVFASDPGSYHGRLAGLGPTPAAAAVYFETEIVAALRGVQLRGEVVREQRLDPTGAAAIREAYLARHPVAAPLLDAGRHCLYALTVTWAKLTDNRLGLGSHHVARFDAGWSKVKPSPSE